MRTPLTVIDGTVEAMIIGVLPAQSRAAGAGRDEVRRLRRLSDDLSRLRDPHEWLLTLVLVDVDLREVVERAAGHARRRRSIAGLALDIDQVERAGAGARRPRTDRPGGDEPRWQCGAGHAAGRSGDRAMRDLRLGGPRCRHRHRRGPAAADLERVFEPVPRPGPADQRRRSRARAGRER